MKRTTKVIIIALVSYITVIYLLAAFLTGIFIAPNWSRDVKESVSMLVSIPLLLGLLAAVASESSL